MESCEHQSLFWRLYLFQEWFVFTGALSLESCKQLYTAMTPLKTCLRTSPLNITMCQILQRQLELLHPIAQHQILCLNIRGKKGFSNVVVVLSFKKNNKIHSHFALSHSPMLQMQAPRSSEEAAHSATPPVRHCLGLCSHYGWDGCRVVNIYKQQQKRKLTTKKEIPGLRQVLVFLQTGYIVSFIPVRRSAGFTRWQLRPPD